jgi:hypothetical protein
LTVATIVNSVFSVRAGNASSTDFAPLPAAPLLQVRGTLIVQFRIALVAGPEFLIHRFFEKATATKWAISL